MGVQDRRDGCSSSSCVCILMHVCVYMYVCVQERREVVIVQRTQVCIRIHVVHTCMCVYRRRREEERVKQRRREEERVKQRRREEERVKLPTKKGGGESQAANP